jgi:hypothetical protein
LYHAGDTLDTLSNRGIAHVMKLTLLSLIAVPLACLHLFAADAPAKASPRFKARVVCFNGKLDSGSSCAGNNFQPDGKVHPTGKMTCGFPGKVSEIEWSFVEQRGPADVYKFTRRFPSDTSAVNTTTKTVEFSDSRVIVFEDKFQVIVLEPPKK